MDWLTAIQQLRQDGLPGVLVTVVDVRGHAPRDPGAKMVVGADHVWGSVGGGNLEESAVQRSRELIAAAATAPERLESRLNEHEKNPHGKQCCGGVVELLLEPLAVRPTVAIFGAGHVGYELARILSRLEIQLHLTDSRPEQLDPIRLADVTNGTADVALHHSMIGELLLDRLPRGAHVLIMTHDHAEDFALCDAAIRTSHLGSVGLIGSSAKWVRFQAQLAAAGHDATAISSITCPIGNPSLRGKEPAVIAVGVASALIEAMESADTTAGVTR